MDHEVDYCQANHRFAAPRVALVVFVKVQVPAQPGECPLEDPGQEKRIVPLLICVTFGGQVRPSHKLAEYTGRGVIHQVDVFFILVGSENAHRKTDP